MSKLPLFPEIEEYKKKLLEDELYGFSTKSKDMKKYEELELEFIRDIFREENSREPNDQEIEEYKTELLKLKYLVDTWANEYFEKVEKEHEKERKI